ncbi:uncharacterized protein F4822DRAFT_429142 [Hypoxylon trugodes]|uniref:uncharacterized protein n=1 Tax=Hypoxylon trugodes TaxID=326681 RepID=UPI00219BF191|nr:uncharacterized protein F4822DRAFT_429142 [Hypoxylon trugodes]KAI1388523.1 hypothetical protein F4822DRAFT_429142 [Hypoxylon trugodes]
MSSQACAYNYRRPVPPPTLRIRNLQDHLSLARSWLREIHNKAPEIPGLDLENCLRILDFTLPEAQPASPPSPVSPSSFTSHEHAPKQAVLKNMLVGHDRIVNVGLGKIGFYGCYSELSFILRTLEIFQRQQTVPPEQRTLVISNLFSFPLPPKENVDLSLAKSLPSYNIVLTLIDAVFARTHPMLSFLPEQHVKETANLLTALEAPAIPTPSLSLFHLTLALGYLFDSPRHQEEGCHEILRRGTNHFHTGLAMITPMQTNDIESFQALLCAIIFLVSSSRITLAHSLVGTACSSALQLGLHSVGSRIEPSSTETRLKTRLLATIMRLDLFTSIILDLPPFIQPDKGLLTRITRLALEAEAEKDFYTAANLRQVCLLAIPIREHGSVESFADGTPGSVDIGHFEEAKNEFQNWQVSTSSLLASLGPSKEHRIIKHDLDMTFNFCHIIVFQPLLHYLRIMADGGSIPVAQSYHALACIKIASSTIVRSHEMMKEGLFLAGFWPSIYTVFMSVMCLIFLIAAHRGTSRPSKAWQRAAVGIRFIAGFACVDDCSTRSLEVLKMVINELSHTVYFDFGEIQASVARNCERRSPLIVSRSGFIATTVNQHENAYKAKDYPETHPPAWFNLDFDIPENSHVGIESEADKMLAQAEGL